MHASALRRLELRGRLEASLEAGEFVLHYQPVVELAGGAMVGVEALVRWRQPDGHLAQPDEFIPLAEETGLIVPLGRWVLEEACRQGAEWHRAYPGRAFSMAVNVASRQIQDPGFVETVRTVLAAAGLPPANLVVEVTESALLDVGEATTVAIAGLKSLGIRIALDDFGTGYSSLSHLRRFPIDVLKIDRSFVDGIDGEEQGERALVRSIIRLARSLDLEIVAEGVERHGQAVGLSALGAGLAQASTSAGQWNGRQSGRCCAPTLRRQARSQADLADLEQVPVGIAEEGADLSRAHLPRRRTRPGCAPVCSPASTTISPPTTTHSIPVGNCLGWS